MKNQISHNGLDAVSKMVVAAGREPYIAPAYGDITRRQKKHEMLLTFMANTRSQKRKPAPVKPRLLTALLSIFF